MLVVLHCVQLQSQTLMVAHLDIAAVALWWHVYHTLPGSSLSIVEVFLRDDGHLIVLAGGPLTATMMRF